MVKVKIRQKMEIHSASIYVFIETRMKHTHKSRHNCTTHVKLVMWLLNKLLKCHQKARKKIPVSNISGRLSLSL